MSWIKHSARRRAVRWPGPRSWGITLCFVAGTLAGCAPGGPDDPGVPSATTVPSSLSAPTLSPPPPSSSAGTTTSVPLPPGTVVPFRTVDPDSAAGTRIGLVAPTGSDAFVLDVSESIVSQAEVAGVDLIRCDPGADDALVLDCARRMATQQVDGWIVLQPGDLGTALCEVGPADVPLIAVSGAPLECQTASVGADDRRAGVLTGRALALSARRNTACTHDAFVIVTNSAAESVSAGRVEGVREGFTAVCPGEIDDEILLDAGTQDLAYDAFGSALATLPADANILVAAVNDGAALGVVAAVPEARIDDVTVAAVGADQRARCEIMANPHWIGDAALFPDRYGEVVVPALLDALQGRALPARMFVESSFVTADDLRDLYDVGECPVP